MLAYFVFGERDEREKKKKKRMLRLTVWLRTHLILHCYSRKSNFMLKFHLPCALVLFSLQFVENVIYDIEREKK